MMALLPFFTISGVDAERPVGISRRATDEDGVLFE